MTEIVEKGFSLWLYVRYTLKEFSLGAVNVKVGDFFPVSVGQFLDS